MCQRLFTRGKIALHGRTVLKLRESRQLRSYIKCVGDCHVRVFSKNNALAEHAINSKFSTLHSAPAAPYTIENVHLQFTLSSLHYL